MLAELACSSMGMLSQSGVDSPLGHVVASVGLPDPAAGRPAKVSLVIPLARWLIIVLSGTSSNLIDKQAFLQRP
jgi:hypothetical protein